MLTAFIPNDTIDCKKPLEDWLERKTTYRMLGHEQHYKGYRHFVMLGEARKLAMYLCQELSGAKLTEIADYFNLHHGGSVSFINHQVRKMKKENIGFKLNVECLIKRLLKQET